MNVLPPPTPVPTILTLTDPRIGKRRKKPLPHVHLTISASRNGEDEILRLDLLDAIQTAWRCQIVLACPDNLDTLVRMLAAHGLHHLRSENS